MQRCRSQRLKQAHEAYLQIEREREKGVSATIPIIYVSPQASLQGQGIDEKSLAWRKN